MLIGTVDVELVSGDEADRERAKRRLRTLLMSIEGMFPMNRSVGIRSDIVDMPVQAAIQLLSSDIYAKAETYLPEIDIVDISCSYDMDSDRMDITVQFELGEDDTEDEFDMDYDVEEDEDYERD